VKTSNGTCQCFVKVYVCPTHLEDAGRELTRLTGQLQLGILDTMVSVSGKGEGEGVTSWPVEG